MGDLQGRAALVTGEMKGVGRILGTPLRPISDQAID